MATIEERYFDSCGIEGCAWGIMVGDGIALNKTVKHVVCTNFEPVQGH